MKYCVFDSIINFESTFRNDDFLLSNCTATGNQGGILLNLTGGLTTVTNCAIAAGPGTTPIQGAAVTNTSKVYNGDVSNFASEFGWTDWASGDYSLTPSASDLIDAGTMTGDTIDFGCQSVPVGVQDVGAHEFCNGSGSNNNIPVINNQNFSVPENMLAGQNVGTVVASDPDAGQSITYSIISGNTGGAFAINASNGNMTIANAAAIDFETNPVFNLTIKVTDNAAIPLSATATASVNLTDVNEIPVIANQAFSIAENSTAGSSVGTVSASDPDNGQTLSFAILSGNTDDVFSMNANSGALNVNNAVLLDFEATPVYTLTVEVTDNGAGSLSSQATVTVNVTDVNEVPVITNQAFSIAENTTTGSSVGTVSASDPDNGQTLSFAILSGNTGNVFSMNASSGALNVINSVLLDFETTPVYTLTVEVTDNGAGSLSSQATVTVNVTDVNEVPVIANQAFSIAENSTAGSSVGTVSASDPDNGQTLSFAILSGNTDNVFSMNANSGALNVNNAVLLDFEATPVYTLTVEVTDNGAGSLSSQATVTVNVTDVNEVPVITNQAFSIAENTTAGSSVGTVSASDPDNGQTLSFAITGGNVGNAFGLNASTGDLTVADASMIDFESNPVFSLTVEVSDNGAGNLSDQAVITVTVNDVNEIPQIANQSFTLPENSAPGTVAGDVLATDPDAGQNLTYAIMLGNTGNAFSINSSTGQLTVNSGPAINFEANHQFNLVVNVTDNGPGNLTSSANVTVFLTDINEPPLIASQVFTVVIDGGLLVPDMNGLNIGIGDVLADEPDAGQDLIYEITGGNENAAWLIDAFSGHLDLINPHQLNLTETSSFNLNVTAIDDSPEMLKSTALIRIIISVTNDADENDELTGIENPVISPETSYSVYPNPVQDEVTVEVQNIPDREVTMTLFNVKGEVVYKEEINGVENELKTSMNLSWLNKGVYILTFQHGEVSHIAKLIKQ